MGLFYRLYWSGLGNFWQKAGTNGFFTAVRSNCRWVVRFAVFVFGVYSAAYTFSIASNRTYDAITIGDELILDYPWPKSDIRIPWSEVVKVSVEKKVSRQSKISRRMRLRIDTQQRFFTSLWIGTLDSKPVTEAREAIEAKLAEQNQAR